MSDVLRIGWQILWSPVIGAAWILMVVLLAIGWGPTEAVAFIKHWNNMIDDNGVDDAGTEPAGN